MNIPTTSSAANQSISSSAPTRDSEKLCADLNGAAGESPHRNRAPSLTPPPRRRMNTPKKPGRPSFEKPAVGNRRLPQDERSWIGRRTKGFHTGVLALAVKADDYEDMAPLLKKNDANAGAFGRIFKAKHKESGDGVVIKMMRSGDEVSEPEIVVELCIHEALNGHPNIVRYHGAYQTSPQHFAIVLDQYDMSLDAWLFRSGQKAAKDVAAAKMAAWCRVRKQITEQMLETTAHMHTIGKGGIVHRDLKPPNFLLRLDGEEITHVVLCDMGFACDVDSCIHTGSPGTVAYMSPEMIKEKPYGQPADIWAMGASLFEVWTGQDPVSHLSDYNIEGRLKTDFSPPESLGPVWDDSHQLLDHVPAVKELLRECFLLQKERVAAIDLRDRFKALGQL